MELTKTFLVILLHTTQFLGSICSQSQRYGNIIQSPVLRVPKVDQKLWYGGNTIPSPNSYLPPANNQNVGNCHSQEIAKGRFKVICGDSGPTVLREHILWLQSESSGSQVIDIEVPNYAIRELIKAGFKPSPVGGSTINVLLKRPQTHVDAQVEHPKTLVGAPKVNIQYERPESKVIHFPVDQKYSTLQGPIMPPLAPQYDQQQQRNTPQQTFYGYSNLPVY